MLDSTIAVLACRDRFPFDEQLLKAYYMADEQNREESIYTQTRENTSGAGEQIIRGGRSF